MISDPEAKHAGAGDIDATAFGATAGRKGTYRGVSASSFQSLRAQRPQLVSPAYLETHQEPDKAPSDGQHGPLAVKWSRYCASWSSSIGCPRAEARNRSPWAASSNLMAFVIFATTLFMRSVDPVIPQIAQDLDVMTTTAAMLSTGFTLPYALVQPVLGALPTCSAKQD